MKTYFYTSILVLFSLFIFSCGGDDEETVTNPINAVDFTASIDENPNNGDVIGTVVASSTETLTFGISSQTPANALNINASTGELTVADAALFDYETNPAFTATISILSPSTIETVTATINLNDKDDIEFVLTTSKEEYLNAHDGEWVPISESEYNALAEHLNEVTKVATSDLEYNANAEISYIAISSGFTIANNNGHTLPESSYLFALKYNSENAGAINCRILLSTENILDTYAQFGNTLPPSNEGDNFLLYKNINNQPTSTLGYMAFSSPPNIGLARKILGDTPTAYAAHGNAPFLSIILSHSTYLYQGLSTTQKQW